MGAGKGTFGSTSPPRSSKLFDFFNSEAMVRSDDELPADNSGAASAAASPGYFSDKNPASAAASPYIMSPWNPGAASPFAKSPWTHLPLLSDEADTTSTGLVGSLVREEGHVYSLAATGDLLYTGSESKNIRVWKGRREFTGFKSSSGLVKAIVVAGERIFTGHQDGKIRVWKISRKDPSVYKRVGTLPRLRDFLKSSMNPANYVEVRRHKNTVWLRHFDAVSSLSLDKDAGILYSGSWDKTVKVWRISDLKCLESIKAHDDAVNSVAAGFDGLVFTGSADGTVKVWRREVVGGGATRHVPVQTLLQQESAMTALAVAPAVGAVYSGSSDGAVNFWRWEKGRRPEHCGVLRGHRMAVLCLAAAGNVVVSGSADKSLCVWRREEARNGAGSWSHTKLATLAGHEGPIKCLAVEEDSNDDGARNIGVGAHSGSRYVVYSGSLDRSVKIWRILESEVVAYTGRRTPPPKQLVPPSHGDELRRSPLQVRGSATAHRTSGGGAGKLRGFGSPVRQELKERSARVRTAA